MRRVRKGADGACRQGPALAESGYNCSYGRVRRKGKAMEINGVHYGKPNMAALEGEWGRRISTT